MRSAGSNQCSFLLPFTLVVAIALPLTVSADSLQGGLFGDISKMASNQLAASRKNQLGNRRASDMARNLGRRSIGRGARNVRHGKHSHNHPQVNTGLFQIAQGVLGLLAAAKAAELSDISGTRGDNLTADQNGSNADMANGPSGYPAAKNDSGASGSAASSSAYSTENWNSILADLNSTDMKSAFREIEDLYGITRKDLLIELQAGRDGRDLLANAPKNAPSAEEIAAAMREARKTRDADEADLALGEGGRGLASEGAPTPEPVADAETAEQKAAAALKAKNSLRDDLRKRLDELPDDFDPSELSPEVREALAARDAAVVAEREREERVNATIFDIVHAKYAEREPMIRGWIKSPETPAGY